MRPLLWLSLLLLGIGGLILADCRQRSPIYVLTAAESAPSIPLAPDRDTLSALKVTGPRPGNHIMLPAGTPVRIVSRGVGAIEVETLLGERGWVFADRVAVK